MATMMNPNPFGTAQTVPNWMDNAKTDYERKMIEDEIRHIRMGSNR